MSNVIYYFSATGNSLVFARNLAAGVGDTQVISMPKAMINGVVDTDAERVGFVFPVYAWGLPRTVADFLNRFRINGTQYIFAVATCGGTPAKVLVQARNALRRNGGRLDAGFVVREPSYMTGGNANAMIRLVRWAAGDALPGTSSERFREITQAVIAKREHRLETSRWAASVLGDMFSKMASGVMTKAGKSYRVTGKCVSCGTCERVCPRGNIKLVDGKPQWGGDCQMCQTCLQWCPQGAIMFGDGPMTPRSHHGGVSLPDMIVR